MASRPYHHGALEIALTDAAIEVVRSSGIGALTLRDLARTVQVSPSAVYRHFPSRDHLVSRVSQLARQALARDLLTRRDAVTTRGRPARRTVERFEEIGRTYVQFAIDNPHMFEAAFVRCDIRPVNPDHPDAWGVLVDAIDQMIDAGAVPETRRQDGPIISWAGVHGLAQIVTASTWPDGVSADAHIDAVISGITRSLR